MRNRGFTLVELLIVVVVIATLMGIMFRLAGMGGESKARATTIKHLQRLENAISGYYAAFGSYPPVPLHGYRDIYRKINTTTGMQYDDDSEVYSELRWPAVKAACRSQPVAVEYPYNYKMVQDDDIFTKNSVSALDQVGIFQSGNIDVDYDWQKIQVFKFGVLSFLLPRYLVMLNGMPELYSAQWFAYNRRSSLYDLGTGFPLYSNKYGVDWIKQLQNDMECGPDYYQKGKTTESTTTGSYQIRYNPSQLICTRWLPNLEGIIYAGKEIYDVKTQYSDSSYDYNESRMANTISEENPPDCGSVAEIAARHSPQDAKSKGSSQNYLLDGMTVVDGWGHDLYYYSPAPYQSYRLWSAGANGRTFPPWIDLGEFRSKATTKDYEAVSRWLADDIMSSTTR